MTRISASAGRLASSRLSAPAAVGAFTFILAAALACSAARAAPGKADEPRAAARPALTVKLVQPQPTSLATGVAATGTLAAWQEASVGAEGSGWRLAEVNASVGDAVRRGQVLATFSAELVQADLALARAALAEAEAVLAEMAARAQRARDLGPTGVLSTEQVQAALTAERTAQARVQAQQAALEVQQLRARQVQVLAPDDGIISARNATLGAVVPPGQELFRLIRQGRLEWRAEVAAADLALLRPGMAVRVSTGGPAAVTGRLRTVGPTVDAATRNGLVYVDLPAAAGLKPGMFARGEFDTGRSSGLTLPQSAVLVREGFAYVWRVGADGKVAQVKVTLGRRSGERVEITGGLETTARVVASGGGFLAEGDTVRVVD